MSNLESQQTTSHEAANVLRRISALVYDSFLIGSIWFVVTGIIVIFNGGEAMPVWLNQFVLAPLLLTCTFLFYFWFWTHGGQTLGMRAWRLKIESQQLTAGKQPSLQQCLKRFIVAIMSCGLGFLFCLIRKDKAALQDIVSNTYITLLPKSIY